jgi:hypothetical protein
VRREDLETGRGGYRLTGLLRAHGELEARNPLAAAVDSEDLAGDGELECGDRRKQCDGDVVEHPSSISAIWQKINGSCLSRHCGSKTP